MKEPIREKGMWTGQRFRREKCIFRVWKARLISKRRSLTRGNIWTQTEEERESFWRKETLILPRYSFELEKASRKALRTYKSSCDKRNCC